MYSDMIPPEYEKNKKTHQNRAFPMVSVHKPASVKGAKKMTPFEGNKAPPGFR